VTAKQAFPPPKPKELLSAAFRSRDSARHRAYRRPFQTSFYGEGWPLYWEMRLWDMGFARSPEDRIGMLFWRMHRCARIIFSMSYHLGRMSVDEAVDLLVDRVGFFV